MYSVPEGSAAAKLRSLGLSPRAGVKAQGTLRTTWREDDAAGIDYAYIFADFNATSGEVTVLSTKQPYLFDLWTGTRTPISYYKKTASTTTIPLNLAGNQTIVIAFTDKSLDGIPVPPFYITDMPSNVLGYNYSSRCSGISLRVAASSESGTVKLSTGQQITLNASAVPTAFQLHDWTLTAETLGSAREYLRCVGYCRQAQHDAPA